MELDFSMAKSLLIAILIGFSIGLQREISFSHREKDIIFTGSRSFAIVSLLGVLASYFKDKYLGITLVIAALVGLLLISSYIMRAIHHDKKGTTTEFAAIGVFIIGMLCFDGLYMYSLFTAVVVVFILQIRTKVLEFKDNVGKKDLQSTVLFLLITFVILPMLPDKFIDPYGVFNPHFIWMMVVLISGLSFAGYIAVKSIGMSRGILVAGLFGGLISSTATTITFSKKIDNKGKLAKQLAAAISLACTTMYIRVVIVSAFIDIDVSMRLAPAYILGALAGYLYIYYLSKQVQKNTVDVEFMFKNPLEIKEAIKFGLLFGVAFGTTTLLQDWAGNSGIYVSSFVLGLTDADAITLSLTKLYLNKEIMINVAVLGIVIASFSNSITKLIISYIVGNKILGNQLSIAFAIPMITIIIVLALQNFLF